MPNEDQVVRLRGERVTVGRSNGNDVVLDDVNVSRFHAEIARNGDLVELRDLDSRCGTRLNGRPVKTAVIKGGAEIGIGPYKLRFDGAGLAPENQRGTLRLDASGVSMRVDGRTILNDVSMEVEPGELVAIIGASGAGKSTLLQALAGVRRPTSGSVSLNGEPVTARLTDVGYVPQDEIVHPLLTAGEALEYAARLRLPDDTETKTIRSTVKRVVGELSLEGRENTRIAALSGGERKRTGVGSELVNRPSLLFLDEPTTGLDPELESQAMQLFRDLADPTERAVVLVTHATKNLALCDRLAVMGEGGELAFLGKPEEALHFFDVPAYDDIYTALTRTPAREWRERYERGRTDRRRGTEEPAPAPGPTGSPRAKLGLFRQVGLLSGRYLRLLVRDQRNLLILLGQVPVIGFAIALLFEAGVFAQVGDGVGVQPGNPDDQIQLLFLMVTTVIWFGSIDGSREIVKERSVAAREADVGVRPGAYILSKALVLFGLAATQTLALCFFVFSIRPIGESFGSYCALAALLVLTSWAAVGVGLAISASVRTEDQATSLIPLTLIPQLLFAGAIVPVAQMVEPIASISNIVPARWSLAGVGSVIDMNERLADAPRLADFAGYGTSFFELRAGQAAGVLMIFTAVAFAAVAVRALRRLS